MYPQIFLMPESEKSTPHTHTQLGQGVHTILFLQPFKEAAHAFAHLPESTAKKRVLFSQTTDVYISCFVSLNKEHVVVFPADSFQDGAEKQARKENPQLYRALKATWLPPPSLSVSCSTLVLFGNLGLGGASPRDLGWESALGCSFRPRRHAVSPLSGSAMPLEAGTCQPSPNTSSLSQSNSRGHARTTHTRVSQKHTKESQ